MNNTEVAVEAAIRRMEAAINLSHAGAGLDAWAGLAETRTLARSLVVALAREERARLRALTGEGDIWLDAVLGPRFFCGR